MPGAMSGVNTAGAEFLLQMLIFTLCLGALGGGLIALSFGLWSRAAAWRQRRARRQADRFLHGGA